MEQLRSMAAGIAGAILAILLLVGVAYSQPTEIEHNGKHMPCHNEGSRSCWWSWFEDEL